MTEVPLGEHRWLTVVSPVDPDGTELVLEPDAHPAAKPFKAALVSDGILLVHVVDGEGREGSASGLTPATSPSPRALSKKTTSLTQLRNGADDARRRPPQRPRAARPTRPLELSNRPGQAASPALRLESTHWPTHSPPICLVVTLRRFQVLIAAIASTSAASCPAS